MSMPNENARVNEIYQLLHKDLPKQEPMSEAIIRDLAVAKWRKEMAHQMEASFFLAAVAEERANPETAALVAKHGEHILLGAALRRDAAGPNALAKILRYQTAAAKHNQQAEELFVRLLEHIRRENAKNKTNPIANAVQQTPTEQPASHTEIARNAQCPCGSGQKYKRCCAVAPALARSAA